VFRKEAGHYVFTVTQTDIGNRLTTVGGVR
jgi:hypothetical protein